MRTIKQNTNVKRGVKDGEVIRFVTDTTEEFVICIRTRNPDGSESQGGCCGCPLYAYQVQSQCPLSATGIFGGRPKERYILHRGKALEDMVE